MIRAAKLKRHQFTAGLQSGNLNVYDLPIHEAVDAPARESKKRTHDSDAKSADNDDQAKRARQTPRQPAYNPWFDKTPHASGAKPTAGSRFQQSNNLPRKSAPTPPTENPDAKADKKPRNYRDIGCKLGDFFDGFMSKFGSES